MGTLLQDLRYAIRQLQKSPGFTAVACVCGARRQAVLTLALGIGANTAIFSVVNAVLLRPLPFKEPGQLMLVDAKGGFGSLSGGDFHDLTEQSSAFSHVAAYASASLNLSGERDPERVKGARVSASFFPTFGVELIRGHFFAADEDRPGGEKVVVLSHGLWQRRFGADETLLGRTVKLEGQAHTVIGILPPSAEFPETPEVLIPLSLSAASLNDYGDYFLKLVARLKPAFTRAQGEAELAGISKRAEARHPDFREARQQQAFFDELLRRTAALPGVKAASVTSTPLGGWSNRYHVQGQPQPPGQVHLCDIALVSPDHFKVMGIRLLQGRVFTEADNERGQKVAIIDEKLANKRRSARAPNPPIWRRHD